MASVNIPLELDSNNNKKLSYHEQRVARFCSYQEKDIEIKEEQENQEYQAKIKAQEPCFKRALLGLIVILSSLTLLKSFGINSYKLSHNLTTHFNLKNLKQKLIDDKAQLKSKIKENQSFHGMKKIIKEELKALDANEILVRFEK